MDILQASISALFPFLNNISSPRKLIQLPLLLNPFSSTSPVKPQSLSSSSLVNIQQGCSNPSLSCPVDLPTPIDTCCLNHPSGHFLLAQFWDTKPALGPLDSWTLHGLWPDLCTGGYDAYCDRTRNLPGHELLSIIDNASKSTHPGLRAYMDRYWKGLSSDHDLWSHEWNKHGTCVSTLEPTCYSSSPYTSSSQIQHLDLLDYLTAATTLHSTLQTHSILAAQNITPSHDKTYTLTAIQSALSSSHGGFIGTVKCNQNHELNEIWMHYTVMGSLRNYSTEYSQSAKPTDTFIPAMPDGLKSNCPQTGIRYLPKSEPGDGEPGPGPNPTHTSRIPGPTGRPFEGRGHLKVHVLSDSTSTDIDTDTDTDNLATDSQNVNEGCLIRQGFWYTSGQCATYHAKSDANDDDPNEEPLFTLASSYAPCAVLEADGKHGQKGEFVCANRLPVQSIFGSGVGQEREDQKVLSWKNRTVFFTERRPARFDKVRVFGDDGDEKRRVRLEIHWEGA